jgi:hypothetical protein
MFERKTFRILNEVVSLPPFGRRSNPMNVAAQSHTCTPMCFCMTDNVQYSPFSKTRLVTRALR